MSEDKCDDCGADVPRGHGGGFVQQLIIEGKWRCEPCWKHTYPRYEQQLHDALRRYAVVIERDYNGGTFAAWVLDTWGQGDPQPKDAWVNGANREFIDRFASPNDAWWAADHRIRMNVLDANKLPELE